MTLKTMNNIEIINEIFLLPTCYFMVLSTDRVPDVELRYKLGNAYIYLLIFILSVNVCMIIWELFSQLFENYKKK